jgi:hypothetical protein
MVYRHIPAHFEHCMVQAVSSLPLTAKARVRARVSPCGIYGEQSGTGTGFCPSYSVIPCQYHSTVVFHTALYHVEDEQ